MEEFAVNGNKAVARATTDISGPAVYTAALPFRPRHYGNGHTDERAA
jgi:hypothetical protein